MFTVHLPSSDGVLHGATYRRPRGTGGAPWLHLKSANMQTKTLQANKHNNVAEDKTEKEPEWTENANTNNKLTRKKNK